ncbi:IS1380 family transposase [Arthrobacter sp. MMS18-M83]|uniref:IS1380 family transposase n=1 Tax=Arthrobacter sp. MMS18-M83 TaxID=2996261 RepID=UPI00227BD4C0|nr:IS1380 family transposase [Arthrobacter sp. MMS18-M83]WAH95563.1 IS1380 family transposase [Arthrobacter sp. MMS18-M83]WAH95921.1 IS1380 family transposase [Arthrobacter sp. MMS18-M83]WAH97761.1 IS1380 family transposase [Arthrobacter sp. MMS18-M83]WAH98375.1 IS1380 family transposase [Arthrobacter sp. MMS18-M83]WAH98541.1 IS1380 family transposase [Arthrobacter sp. MMS18-M83]
MHHFTRLFPAAAVGFTGQSLVSHAGTKILTELIDALGFRGLCEDRLGQFAPSGARHRPGRLIASLALMLAGGGEHVSDLDMLRSSPGIFGPVPSNATVSRFFERTVANPELFSYGFETLTRELRSRAWDAAGNFEPGGQATAADPLIVDLDATLVTSHSDKELAAGTYKGGYGFSPFIASIDYGTGNGTGEILACVLRPGSAGANSADDHIRVFETATAQLPESFFPDGKLDGQRILVRTDSAGASRKFLWHLHSLGVQFSVSYPVPAAKAHMIDWINDKQYWQPALDQHGTDRTNAWVINATEVIPLKDYPPGTNIYLRAEPLHPGAAPTLLDLDGHRITAFLTNAPRWHGPFLDARHRARGRCENRIKTLKNTGLGKLPFYDFAANQAWANIAALALNLTSWLQLTALPEGHHARSWDIKRWRYRLFATAGKIITRARRRTLLLPDRAPEKQLITVLLDRIKDLPARLKSAPAKPT